MVRVVFGGSVVRNRTLQRYEKNRQKGDSVLFFSSLRHPLRPIRSEVRSQRRKVAHLPFFSYLCPERCGAAETGRKSGAVATPYRGILIRFCHETLIDDAAARGRNGCCRGPRGLPARRRVAFLFQGGEYERQCPPCYAAPQLEHRSAAAGLVARNHGKLPQRHLHSRRLVFTPPLSEVLRRAVGRRPLRERPACRHAPRRCGGLHLRDYRLRAVRDGQCAAGGGEQQRAERRAAHLDGDEPLRRHLPRRRADRHGTYGRLAPLSRFGRRAGPSPGDRFAPCLGRGRGASDLEPRELLHADARHYGARRQYGLHPSPAGPPRRETGRCPLCHRRARTVEP